MESDCLADSPFEPVMKGQVFVNQEISHAYPRSNGSELRRHTNSLVHLAFFIPSFFYHPKFSNLFCYFSNSPIFPKPKSGRDFHKNPELLP
jgi:hypothetical protein